MINEVANDVLVFKTDIRDEKDLGRVATQLNRQRNILRWNVDQTDIDNILRIESYAFRPEDVIALISEAGFRCEELPD
ncbi:MAG TPA: hypothetical protein VGK59_13975 [Ohtaekwangia sp.]